MWVFIKSILFIYTTIIETEKHKKCILIRYKKRMKFKDRAYTTERKPDQAFNIKILNQVKN